MVKRGDWELDIANWGIWGIGDWKLPIGKMANGEFVYLKYFSFVKEI